jgi:hypothetical protein
MSPEGLGPENDCAGEDLQQRQTHPLVREAENKLTGRDSQGTWRQDGLSGVNGQSKSNPDSDSVSEFVRFARESVKPKLGAVESRRATW